MAVLSVIVHCFTAILNFLNTANLFLKIFVIMAKINKWLILTIFQYLHRHEYIIFIIKCPIENLKIKNLIMNKWIFKIYNKNEEEKDGKKYENKRIISLIYFEVHNQSCYTNWTDVQDEWIYRSKRKCIHSTLALKMLYKLLSSLIYSKTITTFVFSFWLT